MDSEKLSLIKQAPTIEIIKESELDALFQNYKEPRHYIGFELSGKLHLGSMIVCGNKINQLKKAGFKTTVFLADWHSIINHKLGGDPEKIKKAGKYFEEAFKFYCPGIEVVYGSQLYDSYKDYWKEVIQFNQKITLARITRCLTIMGRSEKDSLDVAQFFYPSMQAVDIHALDVQLAHAGMEQRKIHVLAREVFPQLGWKPPVLLHHELLPSLAESQDAVKVHKVGNNEKLHTSEGIFEVSLTSNTATLYDENRENFFELNVGTAKTISEIIVKLNAISEGNATITVKSIGAGKMSKSKPESAIFIHDSEQDLKTKMKKAFCPPCATMDEAKENPVLEYCRLLVDFSHEKKLKRYKKEDLTVTSYLQLADYYCKGEIHPLDLKDFTVQEINNQIKGIREFFDSRKELLEVFS
ncbi:Tyrosine--tRNA ligase [uncultured archaeon]|nr:Tyrosine--tRNA ligase [uncultured archaeon]